MNKDVYIPHLVRIVLFCSLLVLLYVCGLNDSVIGMVATALLVLIFFFNEWSTYLQHRAQQTPVVGFSLLCAPSSIRPISPSSGHYLHHASYTYGESLYAMQRCLPKHGFQRRVRYRWEGSSSQRTLDSIFQDISVHHDHNQDVLIVEYPFGFELYTRDSQVLCSNMEHKPRHEYSEEDRLRAQGYIRKVYLRHFCHDKPMREHFALTMMRLYQQKGQSTELLRHGTALSMYCMETG